MDFWQFSYYYCYDRYSSMIFFKLFYKLLLKVLVSLLLVVLLLVFFMFTVLQMSGQGRSPSHSRCLSPETEVASTLKRIGDEVQQRYFQQLDVAVHQFLGNCAGILTYENFRDAAMLVLDSDLNGWKQVCVLVFGASI